MIVTIHQPQFMPWMGFYGKLACADALVLLDTVQFKKGEFQNRNRLRMPEGTTWLTVPVLQNLGQRINEVRINPNVEWRERHLHTLQTLYSGTPGFDKLYPRLESVYAQEWEMLSPLAEATVRLLMEFLDIDVPVYRASEMNVEDDDPTRRLIRLCRELGATHYVAGINGPKYMDMPQWKDSGIEVLLHRYEHPTYAQKFPGFEPLTAALDVACLHPERARELILSGNRLSTHKF